MNVLALRSSAGQNGFCAIKISNKTRPGTVIAGQRGTIRFTAKYEEKKMPGIESMMQESRLFAPSEAMVGQANISGMANYLAMCDEAAKDYRGFWAKHAREALSWHKPFTEVLDESNAPFFRWFHDGELNASYNCLDRNLTNGNAEKTAIIFEADGGEVTRITYRALHKRVCKFANAMRSLGIKKAIASLSICR